MNTYDGRVRYHSSSLDRWDMAVLVAVRDDCKVDWPDGQRCLFTPALLVQAGLIEATVDRPVLTVLGKAVLEDALAEAARASAKDDMVASYTRLAVDAARNGARLNYGRREREEVDAVLKVLQSPQWAVFARAMLEHPPEREA